MKLAQQVRERSLPDSMMVDLFEATFDVLLRTAVAAARSASAGSTAAVPAAVPAAVSLGGRFCSDLTPTAVPAIPGAATAAGVGFEAGSPVGILAKLDNLELVAGEIASVDLGSLAGAVAGEVSRRLYAVTGRLAAQRLGCIGRVEAEGSWAVETMHGFVTYVRAREGLSKRAAEQAVGAARKLRDHLPATAVAARAGLVTAEHVAIMARATGTKTLRAKLAASLTGDVRDLGSQPLPERSGLAADAAVEPAAEAAAGPGGVGTGEESLLDLAQVWDVDEFNQLVKGFTVSGDPAAQEKAFKDAEEKEYLRISATMGGSQISGFVTTEHAQVLNGALRAIAGVPAAGDHAGDLDPGADSEADSADCLHLVDLRQVDALLEMSQLVLDGGLAGKGANVRPHLSVHITWEQFNELYDHAEAVSDASDIRSNGGDADDVATGADGSAGSVGRDLPTTADGPYGRKWSTKDLAARLRSGYATWENGSGPIPDAVLRRIACDGEITRIIFGPDSQILNIGRTKRTFTKEHRRAIVARDRHCVWPGCTAPPQVCEVHHAIRHWADDGETAPSNGALLCRRHHHQVDGEDIKMTYTDHWIIHVPGTYHPGASGPGNPRAGAHPDCTCD